MASDFSDYERQKDDEGGLHTGHEDVHRSKTAWFLVIGFIGLLVALYLISRIVP